ncbi:MAG TPA: tetratricopeptide repeat protein [Gemmataceae bacterium]|nr:tetratricopeptide repeat protein [Gemmataceae bacterium]
MRWLYAEYMLKGVFFGLLVFVALQQPDWRQTGMVGACLGIGLGAGLLIAAVSWLMRGIRVGGKILSLILFLILESPTLVYLGVIGGMAAGVWMLIHPLPEDTEAKTRLIRALVYLAGGGGVLGFAIGELRSIGARMWRLGVALGGATIIVAGALWCLENPEKLGAQPIANPQLLGIHILLGLPFFYLLTFTGMAEESEAEIGLLCAGLAVGFYLVTLGPSGQGVPMLTGLALLAPIALFGVYTWYIMPGLRIFKHTLRGFSYFQMGRIRHALRSFRRALALDPTNQMALDGLARVHSGIDPKQLANDPETLALLDLDLCLNRAGNLLFRQHISRGQLDEVHNLLDLVVTQQPNRTAEGEYWRIVAAMRDHKIDEAAPRLEKLLDPSAWSAADVPSRSSILLPAWQIALLRSQELANRVGRQQLALPGRRMEAIAAVERELAQAKDNADAWELKRILYEGVTETDFYERPPTPEEFDAGYAREIGQARLRDPGQWRRGLEYLRMAAGARPEHAPSIYQQVAQVYEQAGEQGNARKANEYIKTLGQEFGPKNFNPEERAIYFGTIKRLAEEAAAKGDARGAIANLTIYADYERAGLETLRQLAQMHEQLKEVVPALQFTDRGLVYNPADRDLLARKDRYYYSLMPEEVQRLPDKVRDSLDFDYCRNKARQIMANRNADLDSVEWAEHLAALAHALRPRLIEPQFLLARTKLWRGEREEALKILEDLHEKKPEKFESSEEEDAWFRVNQLLGDLYLNEFSRPDLAVPCYLEFRNSSKSGADTSYKLGQAFENLGDPAKAVQFYEHVTSFPEHPRYYEAQEALRRVKSDASAS